MVEIYDAVGQKKFSQISPDDSGLKSQISMDISQLEAGIYFIRISDAASAHITTSKLVIE